MCPQLSEDMHGPWTSLKEAAKRVARVEQDAKLTDVSKPASTRLYIGDIGDHEHSSTHRCRLLTPRTTLSASTPATSSGRNAPIHIARPSRCHKPSPSCRLLTLRTMWSGSALTSWSQ
jgi:hypothetical protein